MPDIYAVWDAQGWIAPEVEEQYNLDRTLLTLSFAKKQAEKTSRNGQAPKTIENKQRIIGFLTENGGSKAVEIGDHIGLSSARARVLLSELVEVGKIKTEGEGRSRRYVLS